LWVNAGPRWHHLSMSHELYNIGHLYEAAYAHFSATGKRNLFNVALKNADLIARTFGPGKNLNPPGHQIIETGLIKLYQVTKDKKYLNLAKFFLDQRGNAKGHELYGTHSQDHLPVIEQEEAVGHAVRAAYMYAGMADIAAIMNDLDYLKTVDKLWKNVVEKKLYITGGFGSIHEDESFGDEYELPNLTSYNETCAAIASVYWHHRMFLLHGDAKYLDVLERTLYNGMLCGVSLNGDSFFYPNCMESDGKFEFNHGSLTRQPWFDCACCPSNVIRFLPSVPDYIYAHRNDSLYINLFIANKARIRMQKVSINIEQESDYPWDGNVKILLNPETQVSFSLNLRIPGWAADKPLPCNLYQYLDNHPESIILKLNSQVIDFTIEKGFAVIDRTWSRGDVIELSIPMPVRRVLANEKVKDDRNKVALVRGPIVYCAEWLDNGGTALDIVLRDNVGFTVEPRKDLLGGVTVIKAEALNPFGEKRKMVAIPYYAWSHRGPGEMTVWLMRNSNLSGLC
ncbi:MAG: glycoside hydrolase family 127 protein, partial [Verrucomicrobia bacterium]|nr:glycoside hydrolase family 127 protein [Verrucomicrobiota bacterium]